MRITLFYEDTSSEITEGIKVPENNSLIINTKGSFIETGKLFLEENLSVENKEAWEKLIIACPEYFDSIETNFEITAEQAIRLVNEYGETPEFINFWTETINGLYKGHQLFNQYKTAA